MDGSYPSASHAPQPTFEALASEDRAAADAFRAAYPNGLPPARPAAKSAIEGTFPLEESHVAQVVAANDAGRVLGVKAAPIVRISKSHHRLAQFLALGMDESRAAIVCNYVPSTVSILKSDPSFQELLAYYGSQVEDQFRSVGEKMAELSDDVVEELRSRLESSPAQFTVTQLTALMTALTDRTGNGPTSNHNINSTSVILDGQDIDRIKRGQSGSGSVAPDDASAAARPVYGSHRVLSPAHREAIEGVARTPPGPSSPAPDAEHPQQREGQGDGVRAEGHRETSPGPFPTPDVPPVV